LARGQADGHDDGEFEISGKRPELLLETERQVSKAGLAPDARNPAGVVRNGETQLGSVQDAKSNQTFREIDRLSAVIRGPRRSVLNLKAAAGNHHRRFSDVWAVCVNLGRRRVRRRLSRRQPGQENGNQRFVTHTSSSTWSSESAGENDRARRQAVILNFAPGSS
jgi:hypothetical protein